MLKIKDSVDLNCLVEKLNWHKNSDGSIVKKVWINNDNDDKYFYELKDRVIYTYQSGYNTPIDNTLYDLIKANLVEEVE